MNDIIHISFLAVIFLFIITLIFQLTMFRHKQFRKYSFRNELPFELVQGIDTRYYHYQYILIFLVTLSQVIFAFNFVPTLVSWFDYLLVGSMILSSLMFYLLYFVRVIQLKKHILIMLLHALATVTSYFAFGMHAHFSLFKDTNLFFAVPCYLIALVALIFLLSPSLRKWPIMDKVVQQDGTILILRPRYFLLAMYEWGFIFLELLLYIIMYVYLFF